MHTHTHGLSHVAQVSAPSCFSLVPYSLVPCLHRIGWGGSPEKSLPRKAPQQSTTEEERTHKENFEGFFFRTLLLVLLCLPLGYLPDTMGAIRGVVGVEESIKVPLKGEDWHILWESTQCMSGGAPTRQTRFLLMDFRGKPYREASEKAEE